MRPTNATVAETNASELESTLLRPDFSHRRVKARMSTRVGGVSQAPFDSLNLRHGIGDEDRHVEVNRTRWSNELGVPSIRVDQVHGVAVARLGMADVERPLAVADASYTTEASVACEIQVADCLPVIFADRAGRVVGAAHAGWRSLAGGVLEATVAAMCDACGAHPKDLEAWLGACIGPDAFEVGDDVCRAFMAANPDHARQVESRFKSGVAPGKWWADLAGLARDRLSTLGVSAVSGNDSTSAWCTYRQPSRFFSFRRDGRTGRMAAAVWLDPQT